MSRPENAAGPAGRVSVTMRLFLVVTRLSWPGQALLVCGAFLLVGLAIVDDYGAELDRRIQQIVVTRNLAFITGAADRLDGFAVEHDRYYGVAFELPLLLLERGVGLEDSRSIYLLRHLVTHAFFLVGGLCCSLLVYRLTHSRAVALFALLVFVLQPRLYAHSFFNGKDLPFLSMFMVTLYVTHRAFRKDTVGAFVLCGVCVGILTNLRIMGVMLYPAVLALRGLDLGQARRGERFHVVATGAVFALAGPCTLYALSPYLWANPFAFVTAWQTLAHHPTTPYQLFQGQWVRANNLPPHYIPTWVAISTPLVTLSCGILGAVRVCLHSVRRPQAALENTELRYGVLLLACLTLPVLTIIALGSHLYNDWRHVYFLHAPLCGLAGLGVHWLGGRSWLAARGTYALAGLGVLVTGGEMVQLHPHQQVYFNRLVDRTTPEYLHTHYVTDPWRVSCREGLEFLRRRYPVTTVYIAGVPQLRTIWTTLPLADRGWLVMTPPKTADVQVVCGKDLHPRRNGVEKKLQKRETGSLEDVLYVRKVYDNTLIIVTAPVTVPERSRGVAHRVENTYRGVTSGRRVTQGIFDIYTYPGGRLLGYARRGCTGADIRSTFFVHVYPEDAQSLPAYRRQYGFDNRDFSFDRRGKQVAGQCWTSVALPGYEIVRIHTGQYDDRGKLWETEVVGPLR